MEDSIRSPGRGEVLAERPPLAYPAALQALAGCFASTTRLLWQRRMHLPRAGRTARAGQRWGGGLVAPGRSCMR